MSAEGKGWGGYIPPPPNPSCSFAYLHVEGMMSPEGEGPIIAEMVSWGWFFGAAELLGIIHTCSKTGQRWKPGLPKSWLEAAKKKKKQSQVSS